MAPFLDLQAVGKCLPQIGNVDCLVPMNMAGHSWVGVEPRLKLRDKPCIVMRFGKFASSIPHVKHELVEALEDIIFRIERVCALEAEAFVAQVLVSLIRKSCVTPGADVDRWVARIANLNGLACPFLACERYDTGQAGVVVM